MRVRRASQVKWTITRFSMDYQLGDSRRLSHTFDQSECLKFCHNYYYYYFIRTTKSAVFRLAEGAVAINNSAS
jgi:hypothetical protein